MFVYDVLDSPIVRLMRSSSSASVLLPNVAGLNTMLILVLVVKSSLMKLKSPLLLMNLVKLKYSSVILKSYVFFPSSSPPLPPSPFLPSFSCFPPPFAPPDLFLFLFFILSSLFFSTIAVFLAFLSITWHTKLPLLYSLLSSIPPSSFLYSPFSSIPPFLLSSIPLFPLFPLSSYLYSPFSSIPPFPLFPLSSYPLFPLFLSSLLSFFFSSSFLSLSLFFP